MKTLLDCVILYLKVISILFVTLTVIAVISAKPENVIEQQF